MKTITILLFGKIQNDSRVKRIIKALNQYNINLLCYDCNNQNIIKNAFFYHKQYSDNDIKYFNPQNNIIVKFIKKLIYYIDTEKIKIKNACKVDTDIYYCNDFNTLVSGYFAAKKKRAKIIYDSHELWAERSGARNTTFNKFKRIIEYFIEWFLIKRVDLVITVSDGIADELVRRYHIKKPLVIRNLDIIKPLLPDNERLKLRRESNIPTDCTLLVYQGGMHKSRGIYELIEAMERLDNNIHLLLMGPKPEEHILEKINKNKRIHYIGMIPENKLHDYTSIGDIGIHPMKVSKLLNHRLALPNKFSQYMNGALALALYDNIEAMRIIERGKCGEIFNSEDVNSIIMAINKIINSKKLNEYKKRSRELFLKEYNWDIDKYKLLKEIKKL